MKKRLALLQDWIGDDVHPMLSFVRYLPPKALALLPRCNEQLYYLTEIWFLQQQKGYADIQLKKRQACYKVTEIDTKTENGWAPLHLAAKYGHTDIVRILLDKGANVKTDILRILLDKGANVNATVTDGTWKDWTPLQWAAKEGELDTIEARLEHAKTLVLETLEKVLITKNKDGDTPLHVAAKEGDLDTVEALLEHAKTLDPEALEKMLIAEDKNGDTPLHIAAQKGHLSILETLINAGADKDTEANDGWTPLHLAAQFGHKDILETLLHHGAKIEALTKDGWTPLHFAAWKGHNNILVTLLKHGAKIEALTTLGHTPLHIAAKEGQTAIAQLLIDNGAEVNAKNEFGDTPLLLAVKNGKPETVKALLNARAKVDVTDENGDTPLHIAAQKGHLSILETLINAGADTTTKNSRGDIPYRMTTDEEVKAILRKKMSARLGEKLWLQLVRLDNPKGVDWGISLNYLAQEKQRIEALSKDSSLDGAIKEVYTTFLSAVEKLDNDTLPTSLGDNQKVFCPVTVGNHAIGIEVVKVDDTYKVTLFNRGDISNKYHDRDRHEGKQRVGASYVLDQKQYDDFHLMKKGAASVDDLYTFLVKRGNKEDPQKTPFMRPQTTGSCSTIWIDSYLKYLCYKKCEDKTEADKLYLGIRILELEDTIRSIDDKIRFIDDQIEERQDVDLCKFLKSQKEYAQAKCDRKKTKLSQLKKPEEKPLLATKMGKIEVVNAFLEAGADVTATNENGKTPLHWAAQKDNYEACTQAYTILQQNTAALTEQQEQNLITLYNCLNTPLKAPPEALPLLGMNTVNREQDNIELDDLNTHIQDYIKTNLQTEKATLIESLTEEPRSNEEAKANHTAEVTDMIKNHPLLVIAKNKYGRTPLYYAAKEGHTDIVRILLEAGAEVNAAVFKFGWTPLLLAAENGHTDTVNALIKAGADVKTTTKNGNTPLRGAAHFGHTDIVEALRKAGART